MKLSNPFDPFGLWAGPLFFVDLGLRFMRSWQEAWYGRLRLDAPAVPVARPAAGGDERRQVEAEIAARQGRSQPWLGCLTGVAVVGGPGSVAVKPVAAPAPAKPAEKAVAQVEKPVVPSQPVVEAAPVAAGDATPSVTSMLALQARSLSKAVSRAPKAEPVKAAKKVAAKKEATAAKPVAEKAVAEKPAAKQVAAKKPAAARPAAKAGSKKA